MKGALYMGGSEGGGTVAKGNFKIDSNDYLSKSKDGKGPVKLKGMDGREYTDKKGGINYDLGIIDRSHGMGDSRSGVIVRENHDDGITVMASGLKRINTTESHAQFLEAQSKYSVKKEYSFDVDLSAAEGASVDANIERERQRLAKESRDRKAKEAARIARANKANKKHNQHAAVHGKYARIVDDDIMDEESGRMRLQMAAESEARRDAEQAHLRQLNREARQRIKNTKSKVKPDSWNVEWNAQIDERLEQEATVASLLSQITDLVQGKSMSDLSDSERNNVHGLEKALASSQNWLVAPPRATEERFTSTRDYNTSFLSTDQVLHKRLGQISRSMQGDGVMDIDGDGDVDVPYSTPPERFPTFWSDNWNNRNITYDVHPLDIEHVPKWDQGTITAGTSYTAHRYPTAEQFAQQQLLGMAGAEGGGAWTGGMGRILVDTDSIVIPDAQKEKTGVAAGKAFRRK